ncbi:Type I transmembrane sorting receptor [Xylographa parallela]|nr:Type I transmembrane sorting receptor [Xylographa parallela]
MQHFLIIQSFLLALSGVHALPYPNEPFSASGKNFTVRREAVSIGHLEPEAAALLSKRGSVKASVAATPQSSADFAYLSPIQVGNPPQTFNVQFDTGSVPIWLLSNKLPASQVGSHTSLYTPGPSATAVTGASSTFAINYADTQGVSGNVYYDKVVIGGATATRQALGAATSVSSGYTNDTPKYGLVGLGCSVPTGKTIDQSTWVDTVLSQLASPLFTVDLELDGSGVFDFGWIDSSRHTSSICYVDADCGWNIQAGTYYVGNTAYTTLGQAVLDTGTSLILAPSSVVSNYYASVTGSKQDAYDNWIYPCSESKSLPNFGFEVNGDYIYVEGAYMYAQISDTQDYCEGALQNGISNSYTVLGDMFMRSQLVIFEIGATQNQIGFATKNLKPISYPS